MVLGKIFVHIAIYTRRQESSNKNKRKIIDLSIRLFGLSLETSSKPQEVRFFVVAVMFLFLLFFFLRMRASLIERLIDRQMCTRIILYFAQGSCAF